MLQLQNQSLFHSSIWKNTINTAVEGLPYPKTIFFASFWITWETQKPWPPPRIWPVLVRSTPPYEKTSSTEKSRRSIFMPGDHKPDHLKLDSINGGLEKRHKSSTKVPSAATSTTSLYIPEQEGSLRIEITLFFFWKNTVPHLHQWRSYIVKTCSTTSTTESSLTLQSGRGH